MIVTKPRIFTNVWIVKTKKTIIYQNPKLGQTSNHNIKLLKNIQTLQCELMDFPKWTLIHLRIKNKYNIREF
jgi:hypothetical protein